MPAAWAQTALDARIREKMESIELISAGVAHDMNNILSGIVTYPEVLLMRKDLDEKIRKALTVIQESGERVAALMGDLTTIARDNVLNRESISLNSMVREYLISPEHRKLQLAKANIALKTIFDDNLINITASRLHLRRSIMHLVANAAKAVGSNGQIIISTSRRTLDQPLKSYVTVVPGNYAVLTVTDTGGISDQDMDHIFDPFYTRKVMGRNGTGLELALVRQALQDHDGYAVVSGDAATARFDLYFPLTREPFENHKGE
jgi:signal transduction histidine kinase